MPFVHRLPSPESPLTMGVDEAVELLPATSPAVALEAVMRPHPPLWRCAIAECIGTFTMLMFGLGGNAQVTLSRGLAGDYLTNTLAWGLGVTAGLYISMSTSGGHLNPAVTLAAAWHHAMPWAACILYMLAQLLGAFAAAALVYGTYYEAFANFDGGHRQVTGQNATAGVFATYPRPFVSMAAGFLDQVVGTALLLLGVSAMTDPRNTQAPPPGLLPFCIGALVLAIGLCFGYNTAYAINPGSPPRCPNRQGHPYS